MAAEVRKNHRGAATTLLNSEERGFAGEKEVFWKTAGETASKR